MNSVKRYLILWMAIALTSGLAAQTVNDSVFAPATMQHFRLLSAVTQKNTFLPDLSTESPLLLLIFLSPECPLCKNYTPVLNALQQQYSGQVKMMGIVPGKTYSSNTIIAFAQKYKSGFPLLIDPQKKLTGYVHASITPEAILLNSRYELLYKGAIDNRVKQLGIQSAHATENFLADAISQYLQHTNIAVKRVKAIGCLINDF